MDVFISYQRGDRRFIDAIASRLAELGLSVWFDASLTAGEAFDAEIDRQAHTAMVVLVCWSPAAKQSRWVRAEALIGFEKGNLAAIRIAGDDDFVPPTPFNAIHAEDLRDWIQAQSHSHHAWRRLLQRLGALCHRSDLESWGAINDLQTTSTELRRWLARYEKSPLFVAAEAMLGLRERLEEQKRILDVAARERRERELAELRTQEYARKEKLRGKRQREFDFAVGPPPAIPWSADIIGPAWYFKFTKGGCTSALLLVLLWPVFVVHTLALLAALAVWFVGVPIAIVALGVAWGAFNAHGSLMIVPVILGALLMSALWCWYFWRFLPKRHNELREKRALWLKLRSEFGLE